MTFEEWALEVVKLMKGRVDTFQIEMFREDEDMFRRDFVNGVSIQDCAQHQIDAYEWWLDEGQYF